MKKYSHVRTDLAIEAKNMYIPTDEKKKETKKTKGVYTEEKVKNDVKVNYVKITKEGEKNVGKKAGLYITLYTDGVLEQDTHKQHQAALVLSEELKNLLEENSITKDDVGLIVGLGNWNVTPDALGPMTIENILVTRHLFHLKHESISEGYRAVSAVSPGVMGVTGIETSDTINGIVKQIKPDFIIAVDALASRSVERINETIQLSDTGIHPGSGVGNKRKELSRETLGVPVIAIGVPTVVDAVTIASDTIDFLLKHFGREWNEKDKPSKSLLPAGMKFGQKKFSERDLPDQSQRSTFLGVVGNLSDEEKRKLLQEVLTPIGYNMIVTPKEVDGFMIDMANVLAKGINTALHESIDIQDASSFTRS